VGTLERLQKYLARCGVASRRRAEEMIKQGLVKLNGQVVREMGIQLEPEKDIVEVNGQVVTPKEQKVYLLLNKPVRVVTWVDLEEPFLRTFSRSAESGWTKRSVLERYDHEHGFRVQVARNALAQGRVTPPAPLVHPIGVKECRTCPWGAHCRPMLDDDDISLRIDRSPLDVREIGALRQLGIRTITDLAGVNPDDLLPRYLPEVSHKDQAESRLRLAIRRADLLVEHEGIERLLVGGGRHVIPQAERHGGLAGGLRLFGGRGFATGCVLRGGGVRRRRRRARRQNERSSRGKDAGGGGAPSDCHEFSSDGGREATGSPCNSPPFFKRRSSGGEP